MAMNYITNICILILLCIGSLLRGEDLKCGEHGCDGGEDFIHHREKYYKRRGSNRDWKEYIDNIDEAVKNYNDCVGLMCYQTQEVNDFQFWIDNGGIKFENFFLAKNRKLGEHYQIINHTLYRQPNCEFPARCKGNEYFILNIINKLPDMELIVNYHDWPKVNKWDTPSPVFSFSKTQDEMDILYPAWSFWEGGPIVRSIYPHGLGRWDLMRKEMEKSVLKWPWEMKRKRGFFRGSRMSYQRDPLVSTSWDNNRYVDAYYTEGRDGCLGFPPAEPVPLEGHCHHRYLFNFRGIAASFRFKHLFLCKSLVLHVGHEWVEFFYSAMKPWVHYIPVADNLIEVEDLIEFARNNDEIVRKIATRGHAFISSNLRMEDVQGYWYSILTRYAKLIKWTPVKDPSLIEVKKGEL